MEKDLLNSVVYVLCVYRPDDGHKNPETEVIFLL